MKYEVFSTVNSLIKSSFGHFLASTNFCILVVWNLSTSYSIFAQNPFDSPFWVYIICGFYLVVTIPAMCLTMPFAAIAEIIGVNEAQFPYVTGTIFLFFSTLQWLLIGFGIEKNKLNNCK